MTGNLYEIFCIRNFKTVHTRAGWSIFRNGDGTPRNSPLPSPLRPLYTPPHTRVLLLPRQCFFTAFLFFSFFIPSLDLRLRFTAWPNFFIFFYFILWPIAIPRSTMTFYIMVIWSRAFGKVRFGQKCYSETEMGKLIFFFLISQGRFWNSDGYLKTWRVASYKLIALLKAKYFKSVPTFINAK